MTGKRNETPTTVRGLKYPMVDLFTGGTVMPLMLVNVVTDMVPLVSHRSVAIRAGLGERTEGARFITNRLRTVQAREATSGAVVAL